LLIEQHAPNIILHIGLDVDSNPGVFKLERSAPKEGYHYTPDIERRVFTRLENKKTFAKAPASLTTNLDVETVVERWWDACFGISLSKPCGKGTGKGKSKEQHMVQVKASDDVGTYVCGFEYYISMLEMQKRSGKKDVGFLHVPNLQSEEEVGVGVRVTEELIRALVGVWKT
jgi:pyroglutamyl-peptidase